MEAQSFRERPARCVRLTAEAVKIEQYRMDVRLQKNGFINGRPITNPIIDVTGVGFGDRCGEGSKTEWPMVQAELEMPKPIHVAQGEGIVSLYPAEVEVLLQQGSGVIAGIAKRDQYVGFRESSPDGGQSEQIIVVL
jgi:hypothetical protein